MANITNEARDQLISMVVGMHGAAPGKKILSDLTKLYTDGNSLAAIASALGEMDLFTGIYSTFLTNAEFATNFVNNVVGSLVSQEEKDWAVGVLTADLNAGGTRGEVAYSAILALRDVAATEPNWGNASTAFANKMDVATYFTVTKQLDAPSLSELQAVIANVTNTAQSVTDAKAEADGVSNKGLTFNLTNGVDTFVGTNANDTFNATNASLTALDTLDGGEGNDVLNYNAIAAQDPSKIGGLTVKNIETLNYRSAAEADINTTTGWTGLEALNITQGTTSNVTVANTTAVMVSGLSGTSSVKGGLSHNITAVSTVTSSGSKGAVVATSTGGTVTVTDGTTQTVTSKGGMTLSKASGAITATDTAQGLGVITINGGTSVNLTSTAAAAGATTGKIDIGQTAASKGEVVVASNLTNAAAAAANGTGGDISVKGGSTVHVTQNATQAAMTGAAGSTNSTLTQSKVVVAGTASTTSVTVEQTAALAAADRVAAKAAVTEIQSATKIGNLVNNDSVELGGLTFTNTSGASLSATQVAAAFANLSKGAKVGPSSLGTYQGEFTANFSTGANTAGVLTVTSTAKGDVGNISQLGFTIAEVTKGVDGVTAVAGRGGIANGVVEINDVGYGVAATANAITTAWVNGYAGGSYVKSDALTNLTLANSAGTFSAYNNTASTLDLTINKVAHDVSIDAGAAKYKTLNVTTSGADSKFALTGAAVEALTVAGDKVVDLSGSTLTGLKTVTVTGAAGLTATATANDKVTSVSTAGTTGNSKLSIDGSKATFTGGAGKDAITLTSTTVSKAIATGAGDDMVTLASGTTAVTGSINGGEGNDTLVMVAADAATASLSAAFAEKVTGFEVLSLTSAGTQTVNVTALGNYTNVSSAGTAGNLTIDKLANNGNLTITAASTGTHTVNITDATTGTADVLNVTLSSADAINAGTVSTAKVETVNITSTDTKAPAHKNDLILTAADTKTVNVSGNAGLDLVLTGSTKVTTINAADMTAGLTVTSLNTTSATTITGGSGNDVLTASTGTTAHVLVGGAGNDILTTNAGISTLTGGAGNDTFVVQTPGANVNIYSTITDFSSGDTLKLTNLGVETFNRTKLVLGENAVFQDYANLAASSTTANDNSVVSWFQFNGNTYVVQDRSNSDSFVNGADIMVKLTGLIDLSTASFANGAETLLTLGG